MSNRIIIAEFLSILEIMDLKGQKVVLDQLLCNIPVEKDYYFYGKLKQICVMRDIRDSFYYVHQKNNIAFYNLHKDIVSIDNYIEYMKKLDPVQNFADSKDRLLIRFEDLVLNYDHEVSRIIDFLGLEKSDHIAKFRYFNPDDSKKRIGIYKKLDDPKTMDLLAKEFPELIYQR